MGSSKYPVPPSSQLVINIVIADKMVIIFKLFVFILVGTDSCRAQLLIIFTLYYVSKSVKVTSTVSFFSKIFIVAYFDTKPYDIKRAKGNPSALNNYYFCELFFDYPSTYEFKVTFFGCGNVGKSIMGISKRMSE